MAEIAKKLSGLVFKNIQKESPDYEYKKFCENIDDKIEDLPDIIQKENIKENFFTWRTTKEYKDFCVRWNDENSHTGLVLTCGEAYDKVAFYGIEVHWIKLSW